MKDKRKFLISFLIIDNAIEALSCTANSNTSGNFLPTTVKYLQPPPYYLISIMQSIFIGKGENKMKLISKNQAVQSGYHSD